MDFTERLDLYVEGGMINANDRKDIETVVKLFKEEFGVVLEEENAGTFIAHLCAAYGRNFTKEEIPPLPEEVSQELASLDSFSRSKEILHKVMEVTSNPLNQVEQDYALLHINNLIAYFKEQNIIL